MIRVLATWLVAAALLAGCSAPDPLADHDWPNASPALWQVTSPEGQEGWLFGTVHALPDGLEWETPAVTDAFEKSGILVVEIANLGEGPGPTSLFNALSTSQGLPPLLDRVPEKDRELLRALLVRADADEADFGKRETWAAALILSGAIRSGKSENGVDRTLIEQADTVVGLEGYERQYRVFDGLPESEQADLILAIAREAEGHDPVPALESWLTGDMARLGAVAYSGMLADAELRDVLLDQRNANWLPDIMANLDTGQRPFIAVGTAHMLGASGLPALLEQHGYTVTRIQ